MGIGIEDAGYFIIRTGTVEPTALGPATIQRKFLPKSSIKKLKEKVKYPRVEI